MNNMGFWRYLRNNTWIKIKSGRMLGFLLIQFMFHDGYDEMLYDFSKQYDIPVSPFIFSLLCGNLTFIMIYGFCVLYLFSEVPYMNQREINCIIRCGRVKWLSVQEISVSILSVVLVLFSYGVDLIRLMPRCMLVNKWDSIEISLAYGSISGDYIGFEMDVLQKYKPWNLFWLGIIMGFFVINMIGHIMFTISIVINRYVAMGVVSILAIMPVVVYNTSNLYGLVYFVSPFSWIYPGYIAKSVCIPSRITEIAICLSVTLICVVIDRIIMVKKDYFFVAEE